MQLFSADATEFFFKSKKKNAPETFFSVLTTGPKPAQISNIFHRNLPPHDFSIMTLAVKEGWLWIPLISWFILQLYFPAPLLRCIHYVFEKIHTSIDKKGYIHLSIWENTYIHMYVLTKKDTLYRKNSPPLYAI